MTLTRRAMLQCAGGMLAAAAVPIRLRAQAPGPVMLTLSDYMARAATQSLPSEVLEHTKQHILDTLAAMISGSELPPGRAALRFASAQAGKGNATVVGSALLAGPIEAALANGVLAHSDETDDSHGPSQSHPGAAVVPAALAAGEEFGIDGLRFLRAVTLGYDIGPRMTMAMGGVEFRNESHKSTHSIAGVFGAAAAAACAAGLTAQQMRWVLDYTAQQSSGIGAWGRDTDHIEKGFVFGGMPARSGVTSALLVQLGWNGIDDIFIWRRQLLRRIRTQGATRVARRSARHPFRGHAHRHQEVDGRHADPGAARRHRAAARQAPVRGKPGEKRRRPPGAVGGGRGGQPRHP